MRGLLLGCGLALGLGACGGTPARGPLPPLPAAAYAHYLDGKLAEHAERWATAAVAFTAAFTAAPDQPMIAVALAHAQAKGTQPAAARTTLAQARRRWPGHPAVWQASGELLETTAPGEARAAYERAIALAPDEEASYLGLARLESPRAARETLRALVARLPDSIDGRYRLGVALAKARALPAAITAMRGVLERDPDHLDARLDLARALRLTGAIAEAVTQTRSAFDRSGQAMDIAEELFWVLCEADDRTAATDLLTLLDDDRSDTEGLVTVARLERSLGRIEAARALADRIATLDPVLGAIAQAEAAAAAGEHEAAAALAMTVPWDAEQLAGARRIAGTALLALKRPAEALAAITPARTAAPDDLELALLAAVALADQGKRAEATTALVAFGTGAAAAAATARLREHLGDPRGALAAIEPVAAAHPESASAQNYAAYLLAEANTRLDAAADFARRARELAPGDPAVLDTWGWVRLKQGHAREAVRALGHAVRIAPHEPELQIHLAAAWAADGAPRTAAAVLDRLGARPLTPAMRKKLDAVRQTLPAVPR